MRRHATMGLAFALPCALSVWAYAQPVIGAQPAGGGARPAAGTAAPASSGASGATGAATTGTATGAASTGAGTAGAAGSTGSGSTGSGSGTTSGTASGGAGSGIPAGMDGATYAVRLRDLESRVDELKDQIRRSHTRLSLLSDTILAGGIAGARTDITFVNQMSNAFRLVKAVFVLDGTVQYNKADDSGVLADQKEIPIFNGATTPGDHTIQVQLTFQGHGYGVFTYLRGYRFDLKSNHSFTITEGKTMSLTGVAIERGDVTTPLEQRPAVEWREKIGNLGVAPSGNVSGAPAAGPGAAAPAGGSAGGGATLQTTPAPAGSVGGSIGVGGSVGGGKP